MPQPILVPPGRNFPSIMSPSGGTSLDKSPGIGGKIRRPSLMTACRYGRFRASESLIGDEILALENSARSFAAVRGCMIRCNSVVRIVVAVVSEPAVL